MVKKCLSKPGKSLTANSSQVLMTGEQWFRQWRLALAGCGGYCFCCLVNGCTDG